MSQEWDYERFGVVSHRRGQNKGIICAKRFHDDNAGVHAHSNKGQGKDMKGCGDAEYIAQITLCGARRVGVLRCHDDGIRIIR